MVHGVRDDRAPDSGSPCREDRTLVGRRRSVVSQRANELGLAHRGPTVDADLSRAFDPVRLGPVVVSRALAALLGDLAAGAPGRRVGDPRRLLLALALLAELLVGLLLLNLGPGHRGHPSFSASGHTGYPSRYRPNNVRRRGFDPIGG